ncbi:hypothetical protein HU200_003383 [Digitaria exilis]|uniref:Uncharacterized protein n=1 Tax=Digitaria exilis TaxID=1010633 RepID=A0A835FVP1_9POAL|nr:hypothetical protein HU200_003383 [Digitaria exilis]CAB3462400.1 unnamed protein product [Digitaria exilis]
MAGADDGHRLWDLSRRATSFLRMARLALTGAAAAPAHLLVAEEEVVGGGRGCVSCYRSVSTVEDDWESDELWLDEDETELLVDNDDDDHDDGSGTIRGVSENSTPQFIGPLSKKPQFVGRRPVITTSAAALHPEDDAAVAESSEPLVPRRAAKRANDAETVHHPFGCDRLGSESSSLLLVSSS